MKFVDEVTIEVAAGDGGAGASHFRREKYVPYGGPDGGNGGPGGSVVVEADENKHTLLDFRYQPNWKAQHGAPGEGSRKDGKTGSDCVIKVPVGTQVLNAKGELLCDLSAHGATHVVAKGGKGGKGNNHFKSPTNRAPEYAQPGLPGEQGTFTLSLKLVADVGLVGFPNAGKSTLISRISEAKPRIADYPFTTLTPNLGVARLRGGDSFVIADIPGLIPGASQGKGLGIQFLKHIERTGIILHLIDPLRMNDEGEQAAPQETYELIRHELREFSQTLDRKQELVVFTKADSLQDHEELLSEAREYFSSKGIPTYLISSVTGEGLETLKEAVRDSLKENRSSVTGEQEEELTGKGEL